jgi:hypothetical protein
MLAVIPFRIWTRAAPDPRLRCTSLSAMAGTERADDDAGRAAADEDDAGAEAFAAGERETDIGCLRLIVSRNPASHMVRGPAFAKPAACF